MKVDNFSKQSGISRNKLHRIASCIQTVLRYVRDHPLLGGASLILTGGGIMITAPVIIGIGASGCAAGELLIYIAAWTGGAGVVVGNANRSGETVRQSLYAAGVLGGIGSGIYVTGMLLKLSGYVMVFFGGALSLIGLGMFTSGLRHFRKLHNLDCDFIAQSKKECLADLRQKNNQDDKTEPVYIMN